MARSKTPQENPNAVSQTLGIAWKVLAGLALFGGALFAYHHTEQFLISDSRFRLRPAPEQGVDPPGVEIEGARFTPRRAILETFHQDYGRSLYLMPLDERKQALERLDWVRKASVARFWPDRMQLRLEERKPVAFISGGSHGIKLIDEEGFVMPVPARAPINVPVLRGVTPAQPVKERKDRVRRAMRLTQLAAPFLSEFSEIDITEVENIKVTMKAGGNLVTLWLGNTRYGERLRDFERALPEIQSRAPRSRTFDLRVDGKILVIEELGGE